MLHGYVKSFLDFYADSKKDIIFKCNGEIIDRKNRIQLISDHSPLLQRKIAEFDIDEESLCLILVLKPE